MNKLVFCVIITSLIFGCSLQKGRLAREVNPFVGTGFHGHTYPGATVPFGAVQLSPDTRKNDWDACAGYHYSDSLISGFSHTHLSGTGCIDFGDILVYPASRTLDPEQGGNWLSPLPFSHRQEWASPGYYKVMLPTEGIQAELTATPYTGVHRYRFDRTGEASVVIDLAHSLTSETIQAAYLEQTAPDEISGMRNTSAWVNNQPIYFAARFSRPIETLTWVKEGKVCRDTVRLDGEKLQAVATFHVKAGETIELQVGVSAVSVGNARFNREHDLIGQDFDAVRKKADKEWQSLLSGIRIKGGSPEERVNFYTALYHSSVVPNRINDVNGEYRRHDMGIGRTGKGKNRYSTLSLWDTFRAWHPMMTLLDTAFVADIVRSALDIYEIIGELPVWPLASGETGTMIGYHSVSVIADAWMKGIRGFDGGKALEAMVRSAEKNTKGADYYIREGYIPANFRKESVSCLLEFAYDDWCISRMAEALGEQDIAGRFARRARNYINVFDGSCRFFRGKRSDGNWETPFNPYEAGRSYTEASAWQYRFFVPHDVNGMIQLFGGEEQFLQDLDSLFSTTSVVETSLSDITGLIGQYAQGNEPSHHMAYLYSYAGQPWKTQAMVRRILKEMYRNTPEGLCGNEDCGHMSAWYILSSLGFYPVCPGSNEFVFTSPLFPQATLKLANGKTLVVKANEPEKNIYIDKVWLNGKEIDRNFITYAELMQGGELRFQLSAEPNLQRGISSGSFPYSMSKGKQVSIPYVSKDLYLFEEEMTFKLGSTTSDTEIRYTLDGKEPDRTSPLCRDSIQVNHSCILKARGFKTGYAPSELLTLQVEKAVYRPASQIQDTGKGIRFRYYEGKFSCVSDLEKTQPLDSGYVSAIRIDRAPADDHFGYIWEGWIYIPETGIYEFETRSDDGSVLYIGSQKVVDNDCSHGAVSASGRIALEQGYHPYKLLYFEDYEGQLLEWNWK